jgi:CheY-like chemotaxis protein
MRLELKPLEETVAHEDRAARSNGAVLIVEDNPTNALILRTMLKKTGYEAVVALNGIEGVKMADQLKPQLVLLDLHMPRLDGFATAAEIRRRSGDYTPTFIAVTANAGPEVHAACLACGFAAVLSKPVFLDKLVAMLRRFAPPSATTAG